VPPEQGDGYVPPPDQGYAPTDEDYVPPPPPPVVSVYVDPPTVEPDPIGVPWAPPPMLVEDPGPQPFYGAYWTGGYWVWDGEWVWAHGRWLAAPYAGYGWNEPYYEHRGDIVVFVPGYWRAPNAVFVAPAVGLAIVVVAARPGVVMGPRCDGPQGVFVPPPPGSRHGLIVPAPVGTSPAVVVGAPPAIHAGMQIRPGDDGHVRIEAPAGAVAGGRAFSSMAPRAAHLAAAQQPVVRVAAPPPASSTAIRTYSPKQGFAPLPQARTVQPVIAQPNVVRRAPTASGPREQLRPATPPPAQQARPDTFARPAPGAQPQFQQPHPSPAQPQYQQGRPVAPPPGANPGRPAGEAPHPAAAAAPHPPQAPPPAAKPQPPRSEKEARDREREEKERR